MIIDGLLNMYYSNDITINNSKNLLLYNNASACITIERILEYLT